MEKSAEKELYNQLPNFWKVRIKEAYASK